MLDILENFSGVCVSSWQLFYASLARSQSKALTETFCSVTEDRV